MEQVILQNERRRKSILLGILGCVILVLGIGIFFYIQNSYIGKNVDTNLALVNEYTRNIFIADLIKSENVVYNEHELKDYISNNYISFLSSVNFEDSIRNYIKLYVKSFKILSKFKNISNISTSDYLKIKKEITNFNFKQVLVILRNINLKIVSNDIVAYKSYFEGVIAELDFQKGKSAEFYAQSIALNPYKISYYFGLANIYYEQYKFGDAIRVYNDGLNTSVFLTNEDKNDRIEIIYNLARTYFIIENNKDALQNYNNLLIQALSINDKKYEFLAVYNIGIVESKIGNYQDAIDTLKYAFKLATKIDNKKYVLDSLIKLSDYNYTFGDYESGKMYGLKAVAMANSSKSLIGIVESSIATCLNYEFLQQTDFSKLYCGNAIKINDKLFSVLGRPEFALQNGKIYNYVSFLKTNDAGKKYLETAYTVAKTLNLKLVEINALNSLFNITLNREQYNTYLKLKSDLKIKNDCCKFFNLALLNARDGKTDLAIRDILIRLENTDNKLEIASLSFLLSDLYRNKGDMDNAIMYATYSFNTYKDIYKSNNVFLLYKQDSLKKLIDSKK